MRISMAFALALGLTFSLLAPPVSAHEKTGRYFVRVRNVIEAPGVSSGFVDEAKQLFIEELKKHPAITLDWPADLPEEQVALVKELRKRKLRAFEVSLKIQDAQKSIDPPPPGKQYRILTRGIKLSVFGDTLPDKVLAIGGDGESRVQTEIGKQADVDKEGKSLMTDCTKEAVRQAVEMTLNKLDLSDKPAKVGKKKK
jgi:hypothetical protein